MDPLPDDVSDLTERRASRAIPPAHYQAAAEAVDTQDQARGDWPNPRMNDQPDPPWPAPHNPILVYLVVQAQARLEAGMDPHAVIDSLAIHAWFEGGIDNYDRAHRHNTTIADADLVGPSDD